MRLIDKFAIWWLSRCVAAAKAALDDIERQRHYYESSEMLAMDDLRKAEERLGAFLQRNAV